MRRTLLAAGAFVTLAGCRGDAPVVDEEPMPMVAPDVVVTPQHEGLYTAYERVFDLPLPAGVTMEAWDVHLQHYRSRAEWGELMAFYERELRGEYGLEFFERGARLVPSDAQGRAIYLYRERHGEGVILTYAQDPLAAAASPRPAVAPGGRPPSLAQMIADGVPADQIRQTVTPPARTYTELLESRFGAARADDGTAEPDPLGVRLQNERRPASFRRPDGSAAPITFVRGVREERRNPDALF